jgi:hypothetical protein
LRKYLLPTSARRDRNTSSNDNPINDGRQYITLWAEVKQFFACFSNFL